ncbi:hypothetical protein BGZ83_008937 [Gryganskiella cystojenkinii]|nr:hypothetical protein BGZ83_008937 [Gryganskiella cystojenkinii]
MLSPQQQQQDPEQHTLNKQTDPRLSAHTLSLVADPSSISPNPQHASAVTAGASSPTTANIAAAATVRSIPTFSGSDFFAVSQDPSLHLNQPPMETPFYTPMAVWSEPRASGQGGGGGGTGGGGDYFASAVSTPAPNHHLFSSGFQTPATSFEYFPSSADQPINNSASHHHHPPSTGFHLPPGTPFSLSLPRGAGGGSSSSGPVAGSWAPSQMSSASDRTGSLPSIPTHRNSLSMTVPMSPMMMMTPGGRRPLSQSYSTPSLPAALLTELNMKSMAESAVSELLERVLNGDDKNAVIMLDMRPSMLNAASTIKTAVSICMPNMLLKRCSLQNVTDQLTCEQDIETFSRWRQCATIVLFDASGATPAIGSPAVLLAQKFRKEGCSAALGYLQGGFNTFFARYGSLCKTDGSPASAGSAPSKMTLSGGTAAAAAAMPPPSNPMSIVSPPRQRLHLGSLPTMMTQLPEGPLGCQTPMLENPNVNPLYESVRQSMGLTTDITEEIPVRMPMGFTLETMRDNLPAWLVSAVTEGTGKARLSEYFQKVEISETKRMALLMSPQIMRSGKTTHFSISAGIEQGLKNRYNNIWPYDHTRVKIAELDLGHDDYINASKLIPLLSKKSYIATQGPVPLTFQDFWKMAWEQRSRVVVMLTREKEMGRIKCHQYWPSAAEPVMEVGSMRVTFVTEFLPDKDIGTILVRQLKIQHRFKPEQEERSITQIQYTGWPDFGVPETPLEVLRVIQLANEYNNTVEAAGPMVVHCSAGCGRTGAFCVIDSILTELDIHPDAVMNPKPIVNAAATNKPRLSLSSRPSLEFARSTNDRVQSALTMTSTGSNTTSTTTATNSSSSPDDPMTDIVFASVSGLREQRVSMVQTLRQYVFCYEAIFWHLAVRFSKERPDLGLLVLPPPSLAVHTPLIPMTMTSNPTLSMGNAPITTTKEEFSFFG